MCVLQGSKQMEGTSETGKQAGGLPALTALISESTVATGKATVAEGELHVVVKFSGQIVFSVRQQVMPNTSFFFLSLPCP